MAAYLMFVFNFVFFFHNIFYIELLERIFDVKTKRSKIILFSLISCTSGTIFLIIFGSMSALGYAIMLIVYTITVMTLYMHQSTMVRVACILTFNIHIMVVRAISSSLISLATDISIVNLARNEIWFWFILILTSIFSTVLTALILILIPKKHLKSLTQKTEQMILFIVIASLANIYMIANGMVYVHDVPYDLLAIHQLIASITWLLAVYSALFMLVIFDMLRENKETLEKKLAKDAVYKDALLSRVQEVMEINCTANSLIRVVGTSHSKVEALSTSYSDYIFTHQQNRIHPDDLQIALAHTSANNIIKNFNEGTHKINSEYRMLQENGVYHWIRDSITIRQDATSGDIIALQTIVDDIHDMKMQEESLMQDTQLDYLVGAYNRKTTEMLIAQHLEKDTFATMLLLDLDNFKAVNDNMGHAYGDNVLKEFYDSIANSCRKDDIIGRLGGDEFIVFFKNSSSKENISAKAEKICTASKKTYTDNDGKVSVTVSCSIGIAVAPKDGTTYQELYAASDSAMYASKRSGKGTYVFYGEEK